MKYLTLFLTLFVSVLFFKSQTQRFIVEFTDKNNSPYSIQEPASYLSERSIKRRVNQNIPIMLNDLPPNPQYVSEVLNCGARFVSKSRWFNSVVVEINDSCPITKIRNFSFVKRIYPSKSISIPLPCDYSAKNKVHENAVAQKTGMNLSNDAYDYGLSYDQVNQVGGVCLHNQGYDGKGKVICVFDAGFRNADTLSCFDSLFNNAQVLGTWDYVANEASVYEDNDHGAMVLSCMAANKSGVLVGVAPKSSYWLLRTENAGSELLIEESNWAAAAEFADSVGADIINSSLGYTLFDSAAQNHSWADLDGNTAIATLAADLAASKGILVCNSAGNEGANSWKYISVPADADSILSVGAVDANGNRASFSAVGPTADGRIKPDVVANGNGTYLIAPWSGNVIQSGGTSFSSPIIAGMAACLWQSNPTKTNMEIIQAIKNSGHQAQNPDSLLGWGIPNFCMSNASLNGMQQYGVKNEDGIISFFHNPVEDVFNLYYFASGEGRVELIFSDINGKIIMKEEVKVKGNNLHFFKLENTNSLSTGVYLIQIISENKKVSKKIFKF